MTRAILTINAGSSSVKFSAYALPEPGSGGGYGSGAEPAEIGHGQVSGLGAGGTAARFEAFEPGPEGTVRVADTALAAGATDQRGALSAILDWLPGHVHGAQVVAIGHRVVHGGRDFAAPLLLDPGKVDRLRTLVPLAPLHQPHNLAAVDAVAALYPALPQVACFDTAFHRSQPERSRLFGLPYAWFEAGIERYGFHGLSYEYVAGRPPELLGREETGRAVVAHLGNGASLCGMVDGVSQATSMGFTALDGLPMGTRCGQLDPGVLLYLMDSEGFDSRRLSDLLYRDSGLKGLSGGVSDMRALLADDGAGARRAVGYYVERVARGVAEMAAAIGGIDALVFTAGIGAHAAPVRAAVLQRLAFLGFRLDAAANDRHGPRLTLPGDGPSAWAIDTDEERMIARHTRDVIAGAAGRGELTPPQPRGLWR